MSDGGARREAQDAFLEHVEQMVGYWASEGSSNVPPETSKREALEGLAFSILVALDGGAAVGPYALIPLYDGKVATFDIAGELHERQKEVAILMKEAADGGAGA